jgi:tetratricopeptide (TPR) repeat protein
MFSSTVASFFINCGVAPSHSSTFGINERVFTYPDNRQLGRIEEALRKLHRAEKADPLSPLIHLRLAYALTSAGRYDEAADLREAAGGRP